MTTVSLQPYYTPGAVEPSYKLRFGWAGWPASGTRFPDEMERNLPDPAHDWEDDGLRLLESKVFPGQVLMTFSVKPSVAPTFFTGRVKGRLQHATRKSGLRMKFSREVAMQSIVCRRTLRQAVE
jgi:hypothetical protein